MPRDVAGSKSGRTPRRTPQNASANRRKAKLLEDAREAENGRKNRDFVQVYKLGWERLQALIVENPGAARLYALLAQHIGTEGALVASQSVLADALGVSTKTIQRNGQYLESISALVRIKIEGGAYAWALNPEEVWRAYDSRKPYGAFHTKTLVRTRDREAQVVRGKLQVMIRERGGQPSLPFDESPDDEA